jgi:hypothetical protein
VCLRRAIVMSLLRPAILGNELSQPVDQSQGVRPYLPLHPGVAMIAANNRGLSAVSPPGG